jgi:hypothetical protein
VNAWIVYEIRMEHAAVTIVSAPPIEPLPQPAPDDSDIPSVY